MGAITKTLLSISTGFARYLSTVVNADNVITITDDGNSDALAKINADVYTQNINSYPTPNDITIDCGLNKTVVLAHAVTDDVYPSAIGVGATGENIPSFTAYSRGQKAYEMVGLATMKEVNAQFQIYHSYDQGTDVHLHAHLYIPDNATGGVIKFGAEIEWENVGDTGAGTTSTVYATLTRTASQGIARNEIIAFTDLVGTGKLISSIVAARIFRDPTDAADTFGSSVWLRSTDIHIHKDTQGSRQDYTK